MHAKLATVLSMLLLGSSMLASCIGPTDDTVEMETAAPFAVLAGSGITNTGKTTIVGDVGSHPTGAQTGFGPGSDAVNLTGTNHHDDVVSDAAKDDIVAAYNDAATRPGATVVPGGQLGGLILPPGVYADADAPDSLAITGTLTLDGLGDPDGVFIFQSGSTIILASNSTVVLTGGAQACHVFWQVTSSATLGTGAHLEGSILALTDISLQTGASVSGRVLALEGAVTMHNNTVENLPCEGGGATATAPTSIPEFPTVAAFAAAAIGALGGAFLILRKRT